jgi:hypothetical protein
VEQPLELRWVEVVCGEAFGIALAASKGFF